MHTDAPLAGAHPRTAEGLQYFSGRLAELREGEMEGMGGKGEEHG